MTGGICNRFVQFAFSHKAFPQFISEQEETTHIYNVIIILAYMSE